MILNGKPIADKIKQEISTKVSSLKCNGFTPKLAIIQLTDDESLNIYLNSRIKMANELGIEIIPIRKFDASFDEIKSIINDLNCDDKVWGIMIDNPVPSNLSFEQLVSLIKEDKDVEGFNYKKEIIVPVAKAVLEVLKFYQISYLDNNVSVIGNSENVGKQIAELLRQNGTKVDLFGSNSDKNIECKKNKINIVAVNSPKLFKKNDFNIDSIVIDVGTHYDELGNLCGDVDPEVYDYIEAACPSPRGLGPITSLMLFDNLLRLKKWKTIKQEIL